jgi:hypothetical protein
MISINAITGGGLNQCDPITRSGREVAAGDGVDRDLVELRQHPALDVEVLDDGLDRVIGIRRGRDVGLERQPRQRGVRVRRRQALGLDGPRHRLLDPRPRLLQRGRRDVDERDVQTCGGDDLGDAVAHDPATHHDHSLHRSPRGRASGRRFLS